jgi:KipI family sensor histidine kinase inhibitor
VRVEAFGDSHVLITLSDAIDLDVNRRVHAIAGALDRIPAADRDPAWGPSVPAYGSLLLPVDPSETAVDDAKEAIERLVASLDTAGETEVTPDPRHHDLLVRYGGDDGPDLLEVADRSGLSPAQVVEAHASVEYTCFFLGFAPGFGYLGVLPPELELPRRAEPRTRVPAGSVAIAGRQTAVYPEATPGGWHLIGRTDAALWDVTRDRPALLAPTDTVRFVPVRT